MNIIKNMFLILLFLSFFSCQQGELADDGKIIVSGKLTNPPSGVLVLSQFLEDRSEVLDTLALNVNGEFNYSLEVDEPNFYELNLMGKKSIRMALHREDVHVLYDFEKGGVPVIEGSQDTQHMLKVEALVEDYQEQINLLNSEYYEAMTARNQEAIKAIQQKAMNLEIEHGNKVKQSIKEMKGSFASLAAIGMLNPKNEFIFMDSLVNELNENYPNNKMVAALKQQLDDMRSLAIGQPAPEISLPSPDGNLINLSDLQGNYVLIDFWAAWCKPCREENPNVLRMYNQYHDKGFEILGVSLDRTKEAWIKGIEEDKLPWKHVSDLKYFNSEAAATYQINAIPATYLIDPEGKIIAKDLRGPSLESKLKELFD